jgi:hypothetical protein
MNAITFKRPFGRQVVSLSNCASQTCNSAQKKSGVLLVVLSLFTSMMLGASSAAFVEPPTNNGQIEFGGLGNENQEFSNSENFLSEFWSTQFGIDFKPNQSGIVLTNGVEVKGGQIEWAANATESGFADGPHLIASGSFLEDYRSDLITKLDIPIEDLAKMGISVYSHYAVSGLFISSSGGMQSTFGMLTEIAVTNGGGGFCFTPLAFAKDLAEAAEDAAACAASFSPQVLIDDGQFPFTSSVSKQVAPGSITPCITACNTAWTTATGVCAGTLAAALALNNTTRATCDAAALGTFVTSQIACMGVTVGCARLCLPVGWWAAACAAACLAGCEAIAVTALVMAYRACTAAWNAANTAAQVANVACLVAAGNALAACALACAGSGGGGGGVIPSDGGRIRKGGDVDPIGPGTIPINN